MSQAIEPEVINPAPATLSFFDELEGLTLKQKRLADHWLITQNGTEAARKAGYSGDDLALAVEASRTLRIAKVQDYIQKRIRCSLMSPEEVLQRLSEQGRSDLTDFLTEDGEVSIKSAKSKGISHLIKKLKTRKKIEKDGSVTVEHDLEMYSAQTALELMAKHHGILVNEKAGEVDTDSAKRMLIELIGEACKRMRAQEQERLSLTESTG